MTSFSKYLFILLLLIAFHSCQKDNSTATDATKLNVNINSPLQRHNYHRGDTVNIAAEITYINAMHGVDIKIRDSATGAEVYADDEHAHADHISVSRQWVDTISTPATLILEMYVTLDHSTAPEKKIVTFYTQP